MGMITEEDLARGRGMIWLAYPLALAILLGTQLHGLSIYAGLPERIPTHWGPSGAPDAFNGKSPATAFGMLWAGMGTTVLLAFLAAVVPAMTPARRQVSDHALIRREGMLRGTIGALGLTSIGIAALFSQLALKGWHSPDHVGGWLAAFSTLFILAALAWAFWLGSRWATRRAADAGIHPSAEEAAEERLWIAGGLLYNNPADPQMMVAKREGTGMGLTVNIGSPAGKWAVAVFLLVVIGLPAALVVVPEL